MKKTLTAIASVAFLLIPSLCFSAYLIHLKDGRAFKTDRYWEDEDQIRFKRFGGEVGIPKTLVREIKEVEEEKGAESKKIPAQIKTTEGKEGSEKESKVAAKPDGSNAARENKGVKTDERNTPGDGAKANKEEAGQDKAAKIDEILEEKRKILEEKATVSLAFNEAKKQNDRLKKDEYWNNLLSLQKRLAQLRQKVMADHNGKLPEWWDRVR